jgi:hypothetical protein
VQQRPSGADEDRNNETNREQFCQIAVQHRPSGAGEDRNNFTTEATVITLAAAPALEGR